ncbi:Ras GTPase-activating protein [Entamoeba marina]
MTTFGKVIIFQSSFFNDIYDHYSVLIYRLMNNLELTIHVGNSLPSEYQDAFTKIIVELLILHKRIVPCIELLINDEFARTNSEGTLFRSNNFCSRLMTHYSKVACQTFLQKMLGDIINNINNSSETYEIDQDKEPHLTPSEIALHYRSLENCILLIITSFIEHIKDVPPEILQICYLLFHKAKQSFPNREYLPHIMVNSFLFLRLINPTITSPEKAGIELQEPITPTCRRNLLLAVKILQNVANNVSIAREKYLSCATAFTISMSKKLNSTIEKLCKNEILIKEQYHNTINIDTLSINDLFGLHYLFTKSSLYLPLQQPQIRVSHKPNFSTRTRVSFLDKSDSEKSDQSEVFTKNRPSKSSSEKFDEVVKWKVASPRASSTSTSPRSPQSPTTRTPSPILSSKFLLPSRVHKRGISNDLLTTQPVKSKTPPPLKILATTPTELKTTISHSATEKASTNNTTLGKNEIHHFISNFSNALGPPPLFIEKKLGKSNVLIADKDFHWDSVQNIAEFLKKNGVWYIHKNKDDIPVLYVIVDSLLTVMEKNEELTNSFELTWAGVIKVMINNYKKYEVREYFGKYFDAYYLFFNKEQRKAVSKVYVFHASKKIVKALNWLKDIFGHKTMKKLIIVDTCVDLEELIGVNNVVLPNSTVAIDRREFKVIKMLLKKIDVDPENLNVDIRFRNKGKLESRFYIFSSIALLEQMFHELYTIFIIKKNLPSNLLQHTVKKHRIELNPSFIRSSLAVSKKTYQLSLTLKSIIFFDSVGVKDIEISSITDIYFNQSENMFVIKWKIPGCDAEILELDAFDHMDEFISMSKRLMNLS